jgi:hypothetical protein
MCEAVAVSLPEILQNPLIFLCGELDFLSTAAVYGRCSLAVLSGYTLSEAGLCPILTQNIKPGLPNVLLKSISHRPFLVGGIA